MSPLSTLVSSAEKTVSPHVLQNLCSADSASPADNAPLHFGHVINCFHMTAAESRRGLDSVIFLLHSVRPFTSSSFFAQGSYILQAVTWHFVILEF